jgi:Reverse transcriptase (RNA-dependent DNA polymerase)
LATQRDRGTPQGTAVSPVLANLFMYYAFDMWMAREYPGVTFERYADDAGVYCVTKRHARNLVAAIGGRLAQVGLRLQPARRKWSTAKTRIADSTVSSRRSRSWGSLFVPVPRARSTERYSARSSRPSAVSAADGGCTEGLLAAHH